MIPRRKLLKFAAVGAGSTFAAALAGAGGVAATFELRHAGKFFAGVRVGGEDVSGLSWEEARSRLDEIWRPFLSSPLIIRLGDRKWTPAAPEIGISVDYVTPLREAYLWGRSGGVARRLEEQYASVSRMRHWPVRAAFDRSKLSAYLDSLAKSIRVGPEPASVLIVGDGGKRSFVIKPSAEGREVANLEGLKTYAPDFARAVPHVVELELDPVAPDVTTTQMQQVVAAGESLLEGELTVQAGDASWHIDRATLSDRLRLVQGPNGPTPAFDLRPTDFNVLLEAVEKALNRPPVEPKIRLDPESVKFKFLTPPQSGAAVDREELLARLRKGLENGTSLVTVPIKVVEPSLVRATPSSLGLNWTFGFGDSYFTGSAENRIHNIEVASKRLDGIILEPGETFVFNESLGPITYATGFVDGLIIINDRTIPGVGGGVCQVSTTMFRAAFLAGLPIKERWQHLYRVSYYELGPGNPPGFDASVYEQSLNMQFENDTAGHLMVKTDFDRAKKRLRFLLMGGAQKRQVKMSASRGAAIPPPPPRIVANPNLRPGQREQTDHAVAGMRARVGRQVWLDGKLHLEDEFASNFVAWSARWEIGPDEQGNLDTTGIAGI